MSRIMVMSSIMNFQDFDILSDGMFENQTTNKNLLKTISWGPTPTLPGPSGLGHGQVMARSWPAPGQAMAR